MKKFKFILFICMSFFTFQAFALPVANENLANSGVVTIYPDHKDPHHYYIAPNVVTLAKEGKNTLFSYIEYRSPEHWYEKNALIQMTLTPKYTREDLAGNLDEIVAKDKLATFSGLPFVSSEVLFPKQLASLILTQNCDHPAGLISQEVACSFVLNNKGRKVFSQLMKKRLLILSLDYLYSVEAVIERPDGKFEPYTLIHAVAARISSDQLKAGVNRTNLN